MALTPAERQQRRRALLAAIAALPPAAIALPIDARATRQEAWDAACDTLSDLLECYRVWKRETPTPQGELGTAALPGLASQVLALTLTTLGLDFGREWYFPPGDAATAEYRPQLPARSLRDLVLGAARTDEEDEPRRTAEQDARARAWWATMSGEQQAGYQRVANCGAAEDVFHVLRPLIEATCGLAERGI